MRELKLEDILSVFNSLGIQPGDDLLVHSAVHLLGHPEGGLKLYFEAFDTALNLSGNSPSTKLQKPSVGTLAVPAFNFSFARGEPFDPQQTPSSGMGVFSEYVRQLPQARRTKHPLQSLAVIGRWADDLADRDTPSAFDPGSAFDRMLELDFQLLLLGADIQAASLIHYCEQRANVPYRFWKEFSGLQKTTKGWENCTCRMFARDLNLDPQLNISVVQTELTTRGQWKSETLNYGQVSLFRMIDFVQVVDQLLLNDPLIFVKGHPSANG
jgi:aminoglycoside 3-N-acetyltransferase